MKHLIKRLYALRKVSCARKHYQNLRWAEINIAEAYKEIRLGFHGNRLMW